MARQAVRESLVLLKNDRKTLPISKNAARIHVARQERRRHRQPVRRMDHLLAGRQRRRPRRAARRFWRRSRTRSGKGTQVTFSKDGSGAAGATIGVVVIGETPYAEMNGDRADLSLAKEDVDAFHNMKSAGIPVVVVLISGPADDSGRRSRRKRTRLVAAWLPGTEGQGVADVLFGDYKPTGKLSYSWPRSMAQMPMNMHSANYDPLFKVGYGLKY